MRLKLHDVERVVELLRTRPIPEVRQKTGVRYWTLARLAKIHLEH